MKQVLRNLAVVCSLFAAGLPTVPMRCALGLKACAEPKLAQHDTPQSCCQDHAPAPAPSSSQPVRPSNSCCCVQTRAMVPKPSTTLLQLALAPLTFVSADLSPHELFASATIIEPRATA